MRADGTHPAPPLADADTQAVAWRRCARRRRSAATGSGAASATVRERVSALFGPEVMALEAGDVPVPGAGSQLGWLLWADALDPDAAAAAAERLSAPDILTDFGLRTLASSAPGFDAHAYHRGTIWPFDSWLGWGGLRAAGRPREAERVRTGVLAALERLGRAPELYIVTPAAGSSRSRSPTASRPGRRAPAGRSTTDWDGRARRV